MDFNTLYEKSKTVDYDVRLPDYRLFFKLRRPTNQEDQEYRRKAAKIAVKNGKWESSDIALNAPLWLFDKLCVSYEIENGEGSRESLPEEWREKLIPNSTRLVVIRRHLDALEGEQTEELGN